MKKLKVIRLKIVSCDEEKCWYSKKVGQSFYFFNKIFNDDDRYRSIWLATAPTKRYVYLKHTNYDIYLRKKKIKQLNKIENENTI